MVKSFCIFLLCLFAFTFLFGQNNELEKSIDSLVLQQIKPNEPGIAILIAKKGKVIYEKAFGSANLELNVPRQPEMIFRIGSITKQFTAVGILQFAEQGKISLQDSVQKYVKEFPSKGHLITIENLLTHTSGIKSYDAIDHPGPYILRWDFTPEFLINHFKDVPLEFLPNSKYNYSNSNYTLLGRIIEVVSGENYHEYIKKNVIGKAGLMNTFYASENVIVHNRVTGYTWDRGFFENCEYQSMSMGFATGDLLSNVRDLYTWNTALHNGKVIKKETLDKAFAPHKLSDGTFTNYGFGWFVDSNNRLKRIYHYGQMNGFVATEKYFPNEDIFVTTLANVKSPEDKTDFSYNRFKLYEDISLLATGKPLQKSIRINDTALNSYVGTYQLTTDKKRFITISKENDHLVGELAGQGTVKLLFETTTKFAFEGLPDASCEFVNENGKPLKIVISQGGQFIWKKIKK